MVTSQKNGDLNYFRSESPKSRIYLFVFGLTVNIDMLKIATVLLDILWMCAGLK